MPFFESQISARHLNQDLEELEQAAQLLLNQCKRLRRVSESKGLQPLRLRQAILSEITAMQGVENMTQPVNRIPTEILVDIFARLPRTHPVPLDGAALRGQHWPFVIPDQQTYLELARVCRLWREIVFGTPSLWSVVSESHVREHTGIPDMWQVDRCPSGPLTVHIRGMVSRRMWRLLNREAPRIRQLHIDNIDPAQAEAMHRLLHSFPPSSLEHCKLHIPVLSRTKELLHSLFSGSAEKLRSLYLDRPSFLPSNAFPQLTYLTIFLFNFGDVHWSMGDLCHLLSGSPLLEELHIHIIWPGLSHPLPPHNAPQLNLTRLRAFTFHMFNTDGAVTTSHVLQEFLPLVNLPPSCQRVDLGPVSIDDLEPLTPYILSLDQPLTRMHLTLLYPEIYSAFHSLHYTGSDLALEFSSSAQPACGVRILLKYDTVIPPTFPYSPLLARVEEVWVTTNAHAHAPFRGDALLPQSARSLALTIPDRRLLHETLVQLLGGVGGMYADRPPMEPGLEDPTGWRWHTVDEEFCWEGRIDGGEPVDGGSEMESLLRAVLELLESPGATVRSGWRVF